jgi:hypothetical protein
MNDHHIPSTLDDWRTTNMVNRVLDHILTARPDYEPAIIAGVREFRALGSRYRSDGTQIVGRYVPDGADDSRRSRVGPGIVYLLTDGSLSDDELFIVVAHEIGHACAVKSDLEATGYPTLAWRAEAAADWHCCEWGLADLVFADFARRAPGSYPPWQEGQVFEHKGQYYRVEEGLTCKWIGMAQASAPAPAPKRAQAKSATVQTSVPTAVKARPATARPAASAARLLAVDAELDRLFDQAGEYFTAAELAQHDQLIAERRALARRAC